MGKPAVERFSEVFGVQRTTADDWFDPLLSADTPLCVDPFLIYPDAAVPWFGAHDHILDFFQMVFDLVDESKGDVRSLAWKKAQRLLMFPEPAEFCLGLARNSPNGSGAGRGLQVGMLEGVKTALGLGFDNVPHIEMLALFQGGMGLDRISDAVCNVAKSYFIRYTQQVARRHGIPMRSVRVRNASWDTADAMWRDEEVELPLNPFADRPTPVLLVPERFLRDIPVVTPDGFWKFAWGEHAEALRLHFNYAIARKVTAEQKARMARQNPEIVAEFLTALERDDHQPYNVAQDRRLRVQPYEMGREIAAKSDAVFVPEDPAQFPEFVGTLVEIFKHGIERQGDWRLLWHCAVSMPEKKVQEVFRHCVRHYCKANEVAFAGEADHGRGPVDFEFARGWTARSQVEMKLVSSSKFWDGILAQAPEYAIAAGVQVVYFVGIAYTDAEMAESVTTKVTRAAEIASQRHGVDVRAVIIDARQKDSASTIKPPQEMRDELHRQDLPTDAPDIGPAGPRPPHDSGGSAAA
ncbi:hypothetical protein AB0F72_03690 [Actinoplanes sp. NPDC023936]|uniref:hypothetical protein n=1 Tax=Actinoplanes sp. NPDC023936 TaxID=3154910 RepID=UPI0033CFCF85